MYRSRLKEKKNFALPIKEVIGLEHTARDDAVRLGSGLSGDAVAR